MLTIQRITTQHKNYPFVEELLHSAFPIEERRDDNAQRNITDENHRFGCYLITVTIDGNDLPVGLINIWVLNGFHYVEHLATTPSLRNKGYGKLIMQKIEEMFHGILILEVERPENEITKRRIGFYSRCGLHLCKRSYLQPSYHKDGKTLPLLLMFRGTEDIDDSFEHIRDEIYKHVYGHTSNNDISEG